VLEKFNSEIELIYVYSVFKPTTPNDVKSELIGNVANFSAIFVNLFYDYFASSVPGSA
jgi:hypothetical protein